MASDNEIVQTIKIEVEDDKASEALAKIGEKAQSSFEELEKAAKTAGVSIEDFGRLSAKTQQQYVELSQRVQQGSQQIVESTREVQQAASQAGSGTKDLGGGLDEMSQKSGVSNREMRALSKVMKEFGGGELAGQAYGFYRIATSLGALGVAALALGKAFSYLKSAMNEANETAKSLKSLENIGAGSAESLNAFSIALTAAGGKMKDFAKGWTDLTAKVEEYKAKQADVDGSMGKWVNNADALANTYRNIANGAKETISPLVSQETRHNALLKVIDQEAGEWKVLADGTRVWGINAEKATIFMAKLREHMDEVGKSKLDKDLKDLGFDLELVAKGSDKLAVALEKAKKKAADPGFIQQQQALKVFEEALVESQKTVESWGEYLKIKFTQAVLGWKQIFAGGFGFFGEVLAEAGAQIMGGLKSIGSSIAKAVSEWVTTKVGGAWQWIVETATSVWEQAKTVAERAYDAVVKFVTTPIGNAWGWIVETATSVWEEVKSLAGQAYEAVVKFVTTAPGNAWQWIKDTAASVWEQVKSLAQGVYQSVVDFVTKPVAAAWQWIVDAWNAMLKKLGIGGGGGGGSPAPAGGMASGGEVRGRPGTDTNLAWLTAGEYVIRREAVQTYGLGFLHAINAMRAPHFAGGGLVGIPAYASGGEVDSSKMSSFLSGLGSSLHQVFDIIVSAAKAGIENAEGMNESLKDVAFTTFDALNKIAMSVNESLKDVAFKEFDALNKVALNAAKQAHSIDKTLGKAADILQGLANSASKASGKAGGGLIGGVGTGTSDSNLAWLSRGEYVVRADAVGRYGVGLFHALNNMIFPGFALGGLNIGMPRLAAAGSAGGGMHNVTINFPGLPEITGLRAPSSVVDELRNAAAMAQVRSGGRKPSRYS